MNKGFTQGMGSSLSRAVVICFLALLGLSGCASHDHPEQVHMDGSLAGIIQIESLHQRRGESGLLEVQLTGRNVLDRVMLMNYQFDWLDAEGRKVDSLLSNRVRFTADRLRYFTIDGIAPNEDVVDFRLYIEERAR